jgi:hypothetical protein
MADWFVFFRRVVLACLLGMPACFSLNEPSCAFSCLEPPHLCPASYACGADFLCHRLGAMGACALTPPSDGAADAGTEDAED